MVDLLSHTSGVGFVARHADCIVSDAQAPLCASSKTGRPGTPDDRDVAPVARAKAKYLSLNRSRTQIRISAAAQNVSGLAQSGSLPEWREMAQGMSSRFVCISGFGELAQGVATPP